MRFSIVTPSYRNAQWLRLCIASVADQEGVQVEHIVQDAGSDDGTQEWLPRNPRVRAFIEKDQGMYDAVNRGFQRASGELLAYLNCDEQYLPGALKAVHDCFVARPEVDAVVSDTIVTDGEGNYLCHRYALAPRRHQMWVRFPVLTCALFLRRRVVHELGARFDPHWRTLGDFFFVYDLVKRGLRLAVLRRLTSVFADTGENLGLRPIALEEMRLKWQMTPRWVRLAKVPFILLYRLRLAARGAHWLKPFDYSLYTLASPERRVTRRAGRPTAFWKQRSAKA